MKTACILLIIGFACVATGFQWPAFNQLTRSHDQPAHCCQCAAKILRGPNKTKIGELRAKEAYVDVFGDRGDCSAAVTGYKYDIYNYCMQM